MRYGKEKAHVKGLDENDTELVVQKLGKDKSSRQNMETSIPDVRKNRRSKPL